MSNPNESVSPPTVPESPEGAGLRLYDFLIVGVICLSIVIVERLVERRFWPPVEYLSVDVQKIIQQEIMATSQAQMTPEERQKRGVRFAVALEKEVGALSRPGRLVLVAPAVVNGADDRTEEVKAAILQDLK